MKAKDEVINGMHAHLVVSKAPPQRSIYTQAAAWACALVVDTLFVSDAGNQPTERKRRETNDEKGKPRNEHTGDKGKISKPNQTIQRLHGFKKLSKQSSEQEADMFTPRKK